MTTTARPKPEPFTSVTWASIGNTLSTGSGLPWPALSDLEDQLSQEVPHLSYDEIRTLVAFISSGLPLILTWDTPVGDGRVERTRAACVVPHISAPSPGDVAHTGYIRVSYSGFGKDVYLKQLRKVEKFETTYEYLTADQA